LRRFLTLKWDSPCITQSLPIGTLIVASAVSIIDSAAASLTVLSSLSKSAQGHGQTFEQNDVAHMGGVVNGIGEINASVQKLHLDDRRVCNSDVWIDVSEHLSN
jgi:4-hydroxy-3-methylbut-2-en-1-yl diphosphate synthase IspG/GcpE